MNMKQFSMIASAAIVCVGCVGLVPPASAADWPHWRGPNRDGISAETGWRSDWSKAPAKLWEAEVGTGISSMTVSGGKLFTMGNTKDEDTIFAIDAVSGKTIWKHSYACKLDPNSYEGGPSATPTVDGDRVYTVSKEGHVFCLQTADGKVVWSKNLIKDFGAEVPQWGFAASVLILGDMAVIDAGGTGASTVALNKKDGSLIWKNGDDKGGYATPHPFELDGRKLLAVFNGVGLVIRNLSDGSELTRYRWKTSYDINAITPIVDGSKVFIASGYSKGGVLLDIKGGETVEVWKQKKIRSDFSSPVFWKGFLYGMDDKSLACLDFASGEIKWNKDGFGKGALILADGKLIVQTQDTGELVLVEANPEAFKEIARTKVFTGESCVMPVLANGLLYAKSNHGKVVCLDVRGK